MMKRIATATIAAFTLSAEAALAQFDPARVAPQPPAVAQLFTPPDITYASPSFAPGRTDFTSHDEMVSYLAAQAGADAAVVVLGTSQQGRALPALVLARGGTTPDVVRGNGRPTALLIGLQHGNEPAGGEALLVLAARLARGDLAPLLDHVNVVVVPRGNPDGAQTFRRVTANGIDVNRDHTLQRTPEGQALGRAFRDYAPDLVVDAHEFTVGGRWIEMFGGMARSDILVQYATTPNLDPMLRDAQENLFRRPLVAALEAAGLRHDWYHTADPRRARIVNMGGILPDVGRNVAGLRHAVSFLIETRGVGIGRHNWERRVHSHVVAIENLLRTTAARGPELRAITTVARMRQLEPRDQLVVLAEQSQEPRSMVFVDARTGEERTHEVTWNSALAIRPTLTRSWSAGYLLPATATEAVQRLAALGIVVERLNAPATLEVERYVTLEIELGEKQDVRGTDDGAGEIVRGRFEIARRTETVPAGTFVVTTEQPLRALTAAILEPESAVGFIANRIVPLVDNRQVPILRALAVPAGREPCCAAR